MLEELDRADTPTLLYSSEALFRFEAAALRRFHRELRSRDVQLHAAVFVRDISGHAWSAYLQMVKRRMYAGTFLGLSFRHHHAAAYGTHAFEAS